MKRSIRVGGVVVVTASGLLPAAGLAGPGVASAAPTLTSTILLPARPQSVAVDSGRGTVYVDTDTGTNNADTVEVIDEATGTVTGSVPVGTGAIGMAVDPTTGRLYVANQGSGTVSVI